GEACAEVAVLGEALPEPVEALGDGLALGRQRERLGALVDLDPGDDALFGEHRWERDTVARRLADRLVEQDHAAGELLGALGSEEEVAIGAAIPLRRLDADLVETLLDRARALVGGEDALAGGDDGPGGACELGRVHGLTPALVHSHSIVPRGLLVMS